MSSILQEQVSESLCDTVPFAPPWFFRNGHLQTLAGMYVYAPWAHRRQRSRTTSKTGEVLLSDGDRLVYHEDIPDHWQPGERVALLLHGLSGSHASLYMSRISWLLNQQGVRTFRLDWRGCGAGALLARYPYHSGRSDDLAAVLTQIQTVCPGSPISVIGFSLGGNVALKLLGETPGSHPHFAQVDRAVAVCPPIDLSLTVKSLWQGWSRLYDRYFSRACIRDVRNRQRLRPDIVVPEGWTRQRPQTMYAFDDTFTAPVCGFESAADYYARSSANQFLAAIPIPTLVIAAEDDPLIPFQQFTAADYSRKTKLLASRHGGHLGFCTPRGLSWLDEQIVNWAIGQQ